MPLTEIEYKQIEAALKEFNAYLFQTMNAGKTTGSHAISLESVLCLLKTYVYEPESIINCTYPAQDV